jgi:Rieske Fe-S protein
MAWNAVAVPPDRMIGLARGALRLGLAPVRLVTDRIAMQFAGPLAHLQPGQGRIAELNGERVAAYRDPEGRVHTVSPICTHLRCVVSFDSERREWHCPCHGSRFGIDGEVMKGPARRPLPQITAAPP